MASDYLKYTSKSRNDKAVNSLLGLLLGIAADRTISEQELRLLTSWVEENNNLVDRHPYNEIVPKVVAALADGIFTEEEQQDLVWFCNQWQSNTYYDIVTSDIQQLQAVLAGVAGDGLVSEVEIETLSNWISDHEDLRSCWPYDEVDSLISSALKDRWIDPQEQKNLLEFFSSFVPSTANFARESDANKTIGGICAVAPEIKFNNHAFCFTGESARKSREEMKIATIERGGRVVTDVSPRVHYLVVGAASNPAWAYACYGRKIEKAMHLRKNGTPIIIVHESDFLDAIAD